MNASSPARDPAARATPVAPTGRQVEIAAGGQRATVVEVGGGLRSYEVDGRQVLDGYPLEAMASSGRGQVLVPWPNRVRGGAWQFDGAHHQLPLTEPELGNAIHGLVRYVPWTVAEREPQRVVLQHSLYPQPGYPFALLLVIEYQLSGGGLTVRQMATNVGSGACPLGAGAHPWVTVGTPTVDDAVLRIPADTVLESDEHMIPIRVVAVEGTAFDFRAGRLIGPTALDHAFTDLHRDLDGRARISLRGPTGSAVEVWLDESYPYVMLTTGDALPDVRRRSLAIEPMTCPPNALQTGEALIRLEPGDTITGTWGITPT